VQNLLTVAAIAVAWLAFRLERHAAREREVIEALDALRAAWHAIVEMQPDRSGHSWPAWGNLYFAEPYEGTRLLREAAQARRDIRRGFVPTSFYPVPTEPVAHLASLQTRPGLVEEQTTAWAGWALWKIGAFNDAARTLSAWSVQHLAEIRDPATTPDRRRVLAIAAGGLAYEVHDLVSQATRPDNGDGGPGWYELFVHRLRSNIEYLQAPHGSRFARYLREGFYPVVDLALLVAVAAALVISLR
jgi:hypothetical protein